MKLVAYVIRFSRTQTSVFTPIQFSILRITDFPLAPSLLRQSIKSPALSLPSCFSEPQRLNESLPMVEVAYLLAGRHG